jgi:hypothetical protein
MRPKQIWHSKWASKAATIGGWGVSWLSVCIGAPAGSEEVWVTALEGLKANPPVGDELIVTYGETASEMAVKYSAAVRGFDWSERYSSYDRAIRPRWLCVWMLKKIADMLGESTKIRRRVYAHDNSFTSR